MRVARILIPTSFAALALAGCASSPGPAAPATEAAALDATGRAEPIPASALAGRLAALEPGMRAEAARAQIGTPRVLRPGDEGGAFPSPLRRVALGTPDGRRIEIELYVVNAVVAGGCPEVHTELAPVVYEDGRVSALDWETIEAQWRAWGGTLERLRTLRGVHGCPFDPDASEPGS